MVDESPNGIDVLEMSIHEARHRRAHLRVLTAAPSRSSGIQKDRNPVTGNSHVKRCMDNYPEVEIDIVGLEGSFLHLSRRACRVYPAGHGRRCPDRRRSAVCSAARRTSPTGQPFLTAGGRVEWLVLPYMRAWVPLVQTGRRLDRSGQGVEELRP